MPNHCDNALTVRGKPNTIQQFTELARGAKQPLEINQFMPMPPEIRDTDSPNNDGELAKRLVEAHGAPDWYDWATQNWGVKWDVYDVELEEHGENEIAYRFTTAWCPFSDRVLLTMSEKFPSLTLELEYEEPSMAFRGMRRATDGRITQSNHGEFNPEE